MKSRPTIFLSGVSHEFGTFRAAVQNEVQAKGCFAYNQPDFPPDHRTVEAMLTTLLREADAVIHVVGFRFGAEPNERLAGTPRRSYTQIEYDVARRLGKPVYVFVSASADVRQPPRPDEPPEDAEAVALQLAHREAVTRTNHLYYPFADLAELRLLAARLPVVAAAGFRVDVGQIDRYAPARLLGREPELAFLDDAWQKRGAANLVAVVAVGGEGKTSLVARWVAGLAAGGWAACDAAFAWSFYTQGQSAGEPGGISADPFLAAALAFFGDPDAAASPRSGVEMARRLLDLIRDRRVLLVLDGLEPLQNAPPSPDAGRLRPENAALGELLRGLAVRNAGLCVVTTRFPVADLRNYRDTTAPEVELRRLPDAAGVELLRSLGVRGTAAECGDLVRDVKGHALTLHLVGKYLHDAHAGDVRRRDLVRLEEADQEGHGGHAFRVLDAYSAWFEREGERGRRATAVLRLLGLFDRPATGACLDALRAAPAIPGLTEPLIDLSEAQWNLTLTRLAEARLVTAHRDAAGGLVSVDAHPLVREYFSRRLQGPAARAAWSEGHRRLYEHLCAATPDRDQPVLADLEPLYQAVRHGCAAGLYGHALGEVYRRRIARGADYYNARKLGAFGADLAAVAAFFDEPWTAPVRSLPEADRSWLLAVAAFGLRTLGRLGEAVRPLRAGLRMAEDQGDWTEAALRAGNLSEVELTLGQVEAAVASAGRAVEYADRSGDAFQRESKRVRLADALHQAGRRDEAGLSFREAEAIQAVRRPGLPLLYATRGFLYCDLLLAEAERAVWKAVAAGRPSSGDLEAVAARAARTLRIAEANGWLLSLALDRLTLARAALYGGLPDAGLHFDAAVDGLRRAGQEDQIPRGLLGRALFFRVAAATAWEERSRSDLDEAWAIAERGPMRLYMADVLLHRARLFQAVVPYPWPGSARDDLAASRRLVEQCGYWRRGEELEDAETWIA